MRGLTFFTIGYSTCLALISGCTRQPDLLPLNEIEVSHLRTAVECEIYEALPRGSDPHYWLYEWVAQIQFFTLEENKRAGSIRLSAETPLNPGLVTVSLSPTPAVQSIERKNTITRSTTYRLYLDDVGECGFNDPEYSGPRIIGYTGVKGWIGEDLAEKDPPHTASFSQEFVVATGAIGAADFALLPVGEWLFGSRLGLTAEELRSHKVSITLIPAEAPVQSVNRGAAEARRRAAGPPKEIDSETSQALDQAVQQFQLQLLQRESLRLD